MQNEKQDKLREKWKSCGKFIVYGKWSDGLEESKG